MAAVRILQPYAPASCYYICSKIKRHYSLQKAPSGYYAVVLPFKSVMQHAKKVLMEHLICSFNPKTDLRKNYNSKSNMA